MPIYTYKCKNCGRVTEKFKTAGSNGSEQCEYCSSEAIRVFTPAGLIFKGSGFYTTDYKSSGSTVSAKNSSNKSAEKEIKKSQTGPEISSDKKTDPKEKSSLENTSSGK